MTLDSKFTYWMYMCLKQIKVGIGCVTDSWLVGVLNDLFPRLTHSHHQIFYAFLLFSIGEGTIKDPLAILLKSLKITVSLFSQIWVVLRKLTPW